METNCWPSLMAGDQVVILSPGEALYWSPGQQVIALQSFNAVRSSLSLGPVGTAWLGVLSPTNL